MSGEVKKEDRMAEKEKNGFPVGYRGIFGMERVKYRWGSPMTLSICSEDGRMDGILYGLVYLV